MNTFTEPGWTKPTETTVRPKTSRHKVLSIEELATVRARHPGAKIANCHGVFDVLHEGHLKYFQAAKRMGDILIVTITADRYVNKGPGRPYFQEAKRAQMIAALELVDYVAISPFPTAVTLLETLKPDFYVKGPDYRDKTKDVTGGIYEEESAVERGGGKLVFTEDETFSSSTLINRFFMKWSEDQERMIDLAKRLDGETLLARVLEKASQLSVSVIGEPIVDTYVFCTPEAISSKSPSISARYLYEEDYAGGSLAIANHLVDFVGELHLTITHGGEPYFLDLLKSKLDPRIKLHAVTLPNVPTPRKTRYIAVDNSQRIFELTNVRSDQWTNHSSKDFVGLIHDQAGRSDLNVLCDFGHGLFENSALEAVGQMKGFVAVNVQTNSSNFGFNPFTKHKNYSFLSIDTREARMAYHDRFAAPVDLGRRIYEDVSKIVGASVAMTLGQNGSYFFSSQTGKDYFSPAFADRVLDATGAGDAFFALTSLLLRCECPPEMLPFLGNVFAGLKTKIIGNKSAVPKSQFVKAVTSILK